MNVGNMAGHGHEESAHKGWRKYFDTYTMIGRRNATFATFALYALIYIGLKFSPKKKPDEDKKKK